MNSKGTFVSLICKWLSSRSGFLYSRNTCCQTAVECAQIKQSENSLSFSLYTPYRMPSNLGADIMLNMISFRYQTQMIWVDGSLSTNATIVLCLSQWIYIYIFFFTLTISQHCRNTFILINHSNSTNFHLPGAEWTYPSEEESLILFFNLTTHRLRTHPPTQLYTKTQYDRWMVFSQNVWNGPNWSQFMMLQVLTDSRVIVNPGAFERW